MTRDVRIIDGKLKIVQVIDNKIVKIIGDYNRINKVQTKEEKEELIHERNYGKRERYQKPGKVIKGPDKYRKNILNIKINRGIIKSDTLQTKGTTTLLNDWAKKRGYNSYDELLNIVALGRGFTCYGEYDKVWMYYPGMPSPIKENRRDPRFLGMYIAENGAAKIFQGSQKMPYKNPGYDIICPEGYRLDVKATTLGPYNIFHFHIGRNMIADYFVLIGFNNIIELKPLHLWIIKNDEDIHGCPIKNLNLLSISNESRCLDNYKKYERMDKLGELKNICNTFDAKNRIYIKDFDFPNKSLILNVVLKLRMEGKNEILPTDILHILDDIKKEKVEKKVPHKLSIIPRDECRYSGQR